MLLKISIVDDKNHLSVKLRLQLMIIIIKRHSADSFLS